MGPDPKAPKRVEVGARQTGRVILSLGLVMWASSVCANAVQAAGPWDSVVRVTSVVRLPNAVRPWTQQNPVDVGGTGVVIDGKGILTVAHIMTYAEEI
jgi:hypothetical protein